MNGQVKIVGSKVAFKPKHWQNEYNHNKKHIVPHYGSIGRLDQEFLIKHSNVKKICEIGTGSGRSTKALGTHNAEIHTIDQYDHGAKLIPKSAKFYFMHSQHFWKTYNISGFNLYFIDASIKLVDAEEIFKRSKKKCVHDQNTHPDYIISHDLLGIRF